MVETYYVGVYWGTRGETAQECAHRLKTCLTCVSTCDEQFARWFEKGDSLFEAQQYQVHLDDEELTAFLLANPDSRKTPFIAGLWTGHDEDDEAGGLSIICGNAAPVIPNNCILGLPKSEQVRARILNTTKLMQLLECLVLAWEPDWGVVMSHNYQEIARKPPHFHSPRIGWITYFSADRGAVPSLASPTRIIPVSDMGSMIVITDERFTADNQKHVQTADEVMEILSQTDLLKPWNQIDS